MLTRDDLLCRLSEMRCVAADWLYPGCPAPTEAATASLYKLASDFLANGNIPYIYPTAEGGYSIEWLDDSEDYYITSEGDVALLPEGDLITTG
jgi:hypothetical protein